MFFMFLKHMSNSCQSDIIYYLIYKLFFLCIILDYKNSKFIDLIDDIVNDLWSWNFTNIEDIRRKCNPMVDLSKFTSNKKKLSKFVAYGYN